MFQAHAFDAEPAAPLRPARPALHVLSDRAAVLDGLRRARAARSGPRNQRRPDPAPAVDLRARSVLPESLLLLRLQSRHHARPVAGGNLPRAPVPRDRDDRGRCSIATARSSSCTSAAARPISCRRRSCAKWSIRLRRHFHFAERHDRDLSIELDPRSLSPGDVAEFARSASTAPASACRTSIPAVQAAVNRVQSVEETLAIIEACRRDGLRSVNVDLIYGLPKQTPRRIRENARHGDRGAPRPARGLQLRASAGRCSRRSGRSTLPTCRRRTSSSRCCNSRSRSY